eukprot:SAG31_NODE_228_length_19803_cov_29.496498_11_plen_76_part_00
MNCAWVSWRIELSETVRGHSLNITMSSNGDVTFIAPIHYHASDSHLPRFPGLAAKHCCIFSLNISISADAYGSDD